MTRFFTAVISILLTVSAYAQGAAPEEPIQAASGYATVIFIVLFIGFCVGIVWMMMRSGKKEKTQEEKKEDESSAGPTT